MDMFMGSYFQRKVSKGFEDTGKDIQNVVDETTENVTKWWNGMFGITQQPLGGVLEKYNIPKGIFPKNHSRYKFEPYEVGNSGKLTIIIPNIMEVRFSDGHMLRFATEVICSIEEGHVTDIKGMKSQGNLRWLDVTAIIVMGGKLDFMCGSKRSKEIKWYSSPRDGVEVYKY